MRPLSFEEDLSQLIDRAKPAMLFDGSTPDELDAWQGRFPEWIRASRSPSPPGP